MYLPHGGLAQSRHLMLEIKGRHLVGLSKFGKHRQPSINHYTLPIQPPHFYFGNTSDPWEAVLGGSKLYRD